MNRPRLSAGKESSFIPITWGYRSLLIGYIVLYNFIIPSLSEILHADAAPLASWRYIAEVMYQLLLFLPILFYRTTYGWLHPLICTTLISLLVSLIRSPEQLFAPFLIFSEPPSSELAHIALWGWSQEAIAQAILKAKLISVLALAIYYIGYFLGPSLRILCLRFPKAHNVVSKALLVVAISVIVFLSFIHSRGGLTTHLSSWHQGRSLALEGLGPVVALIESGMVGSLIWFALDRAAYRNPLFWVAILFSVPVGFFVSGSRSTVIYSMVLFLIIWMLRHQKLPRGRIIAGGMAAFILFGTLGSFRSSMGKGDIDWAVFTEFSLQKSLEAANQEADFRSINNGYLPIVAKVPDEVDFLYGESYVAVLLFFVPRTLWPGKPHSAGAKNGEIIFGGGAGVPPGAVGEAYWNFWLPGVVLIFFLYGLFHRWLASMFAHYAREPAFWVLYTLTLYRFSPSGIEMIGYLHKIIPAIALLYWMGALSFNKKSPMQNRL